MTRPLRRGATPVTREDVTARLGRYAPLVAEWNAFARAMLAPRPTCIVANGARIGRDHLAALCRAEAMPVTHVAWTDAALRVPPDARPGRWWPHQAGLMQVQEEASLLPTHLLDAQPGESVLDLCAAPGGKAARIAIMLGGTGTVIANDKNAGRLAAIRDKMKRLGLPNLTTTVYDGADFPLAAGPFDRVLVDAPCTAEGTQFAGGASFVASSKDFARKLQGQQRALLRRALRLVRPGGRVVYATCSLAPEENEAVLDAVLAGRDDIGVRAVALPGLRADGGITSWDGAAFHPEVANAIRLWPHRSATGGFFAAVVERTASEDPDGDRPAGPALDRLGTAVDDDPRLGTLRDHYGLSPEVWRGLRFHARGDDVHATSADHAPMAKPRPQASGFPVFKRAASWPKPSTAAAMRLGDPAVRNVVDLTRDQRDAYQRRRAFRIEPDQVRACTGRGYVIVRYAGLSLGAAFLTGLDPPEIRSEFPRVWVPHGDRDAESPPT